MTRDPLLDLLVQVRLRPVRSAEYLRMYCPFHPNPSGRTLWVEHTTGWWGCFSTRCPQHRGGQLWELLRLRGVDARVARGVVLNLNLQAREHRERPETMSDRDHAGVVTEAHVSAWSVDWYLASEVCASVLRVGEICPNRPISEWAPACPAVPGQVEHDFWAHLWWPLIHRGLAPHALDLMDTGLDRERGLLVFPVRAPDGTLRGVGRRECQDGAKYSLDSCVWRSGEPEYVYREVHRRDTFYGWSQLATRIEAGEPVILVEGYADQLRLAGLGYCAVALLGKTVSEPQVALLSMAPGPKILWPDFDHEGLNAARRAVVRLAGLPRVRVVSDGCGVKDAGSSSVDGRLAARAISSAVPPAMWLADVSNVLAQAVTSR